MLRVEHLLGLVAFVGLAPATAAQDAPKPVNPSALHVTGLTQLNAGVVEIALEALAHRNWRCVSCEVNQVAEGPCPTCKGPMIPVEQTLLCAVEVDVPAGTLRFDVLPGQAVRLSEIQAALTRFKIVIPPDRQFISHASTLVVSGPASQEDVAKLVAKLKDSKLFEKVTGTFDVTARLAELAVQCVGSPSRIQVEEALAKAGAKDKLVDIIWAAGAHAGSGRN